MIDLQGGELHHSGPHPCPPLISWKGRVSDGSVRTIPRLLCQTWSVQPWWAAVAIAAEQRPTPIRGRNGVEPKPAARPLYRPCNNLAMLHGRLAKLMRMSVRNMWLSKGPKINRQP
jgi:hypothetical protein